MTKKYVLISDHELSTTVKVGDKLRIVRFAGGSRNAGTRGYIVTDNEALQTAIEKDSGFGTTFRLEGEFEPISVESPIKRGEGADLREMLIDPEHAIEETSVTSVQMAKNWLQKNQGHVFESTRAMDIKIEAAQKYNVLFVNW